MAERNTESFPFPAGSASSSVGDLLTAKPRETLSRLYEQHQMELARKRPGAATDWLYFLCTLVIIGSGLMFVSMFVGPKFAKIGKDFNVKFNWVTSTLMELGPWLAPSIAVAASAVLLLAVCQSIWLIVSTRRLDDSWAVRLAGWLGRKLPVLSAVQRTQALSDGLAVLASHLRSGHDWTGSLQHAGDAVTPDPLKQVFHAWAGRIQQGQAPSDAARQAGMPALVSGMLVEADHGEQAIQSLSFLQRHYDNALHRVLLLIQAAVVPALTMVLGLLVGWHCLAIMLFLRDLMKGIMPEFNG